MNPEFRRQLWLQLSTSRLVLMPALLLLAALAVLLSGAQQPMDSLASAAIMGFVALVYGMGSNSAGASIIEELQERTWDQQRMSAMQPWAMTWGKLAGAPAYAWYGGLMCLLLFVPAALLAGWDRVPQMALSALLGGVFLHALMLTINLQPGISQGRLAQRGGIWMLLILLPWLIGFLAGLSANSQVEWWGLEIDTWAFTLASLAVFAPCMLLGAWRQMAENLAVRHLPWGWPALALLLTLYLGGFPERFPLALTGLLVCTALTYAALLAQPQSRILWQRVLSRAADGAWRAALLQLPPWITSLVLVWPFALAATLSLGSPGHGLPEDGLGNLQQPLVLALLLLRDCCLVLFFSFDPKARRPLGAFMITALVLYALLPWLFAVADLPLVAGLFSPLSHVSPMALVIAALHGGVAVLLLRWRWQQTRP